MTKKWWIFLLRVIIFHRKSPPYKFSVWKTLPSKVRVTRDGVSGIMICTINFVWKTIPKYCPTGRVSHECIPPDTSCPVTLVSLGIAFQAWKCGQVWNLPLRWTDSLLFEPVGISDRFNPLPISTISVSFSIHSRKMRIYAKISNGKWQNWMDPQLFTREKCVYTQKYRIMICKVL